MDWDAVGAVAEIFGALAVLTTLAFLAVQVSQAARAQRESNALARAAAVDEVYRQFTGHRKLIASDADIARLWLDGCEGRRLDPVQQTRFDALALDYFMVHVTWATRGLLGANDALAVAAVDALAGDLSASEGLRGAWDSCVLARSNPVFHGAVEAAIERIGEPATAAAADAASPLHD